MSQLWETVDEYITALLAPPDAALEQAVQNADAADLPAIAVTAPQGKLLHLLARAINARAILEIGTLAGYSTIWLARALPAGGRLVTLEIDARHAEVARANLEQAGLSAVVEVRLGSAHDTLKQLEAENAGPFDLIFIDADKVSTPAYLDSALRLARPGSLIIIDNVVRDGKVTDAASDDASVQGVRRALDMLAADPRLVSTAIQTVGSKGYDGFAIAWVATM